MKLTVIVVVAHDDFLNLAVNAHLRPEVLVEGIEVILQLRSIQLVVRLVRWVLVEVRQEDRLRVRRLDMLPGAAVAVSACADLVVE